MSDQSLTNLGELMQENATQRARIEELEQQLGMAADAIVRERDRADEFRFDAEKRDCYACPAKEHRIEELEREVERLNRPTLHDMTPMMQEVCNAAIAEAVAEERRALREMVERFKDSTDLPVAYRPMIVGITQNLLAALDAREEPKA